MTQDLRVAMTTSLNDRLVAPLRRVLDEIERNLKDVQSELHGVRRASEQTGRSMGEMPGPLRAARQVAELSRHTQNATTLAERLERAWNRTGAVMKGIGSAMAAFQAAKYVMAGPLQQAANYEKQLADASNVAYAPKERRAGMKEMDSAVVAAVQGGGGTRESALKALQSLFAANIDKKDVLTLLPTMQKYATAGNADPENVAQLVIYGLRSLKLPAGQIPLMLDKTLASTKQGSMEFDTLAKWMPIVGAAGGAAGLAGMGGYEQMLAALQVSRLTAGTKDEAGTNVRDLLSLINGHALSTAAKHMGIDAAGSIAAHIGKGGNALSGIVALADHVASSDPRFAALDKKMKASGTQRDRNGAPIYSPEQEEIMRQQAALFQGTALGKLFHNQQSMQELMALRNNRDYFKELLAGTGAAVGQVGQQDFETVRGTSFFQMQQAANEQLFAQTRALTSANSALANYSEGTTALYRKYPEFGEVLEAAKLAVAALGAAAAGAGAALLLLGGGKAAAAVGAGAAAAGAGAGGAAARAGYSSLMNGPAATAAGAGAGSGSLAVAGAVALPLAVLGAGVYMSDRMNTVSGLTERINARNARIKELGDLAALDGHPGKYDREIEALTSDRDTLRARYGAQIGGGRGVVNPPMASAGPAAPQVNVKVFLDGREMNAHVESEATFQARRH